MKFLYILAVLGVAVTGTIAPPQSGGGSRP